MTDPDLFAEPRTCLTCAFCEAGQTGRYCDLSKRDTVSDAPACDKYVWNGRSEL